MTNLPEAFCNQMKQLLGEEYDAYLSSFDACDEKGLWCHPDALTHLSDNISCIPGISKQGVLYHGEPIGKHPFHHAGAVYSQDPGAMCVIGAYEFPKYAKVLDLCAAPGGKSTQIASKLMALDGVLVSNEPNPTRNKILCSNIERMGFTNVLVTKLLPEEIAMEYPSYFDVILVDAPCSGEGMFRKYPESISEWSLDNVNHCANRQKEILKDIEPALKPGGKLIYSTCTYNESEDDEIVSYLLNQLNFLPDTMPEGIRSYLSDNLHYKEYASFSGRFYPHQSHGEGQFMAYLRKDGSLIPDEKHHSMIPLKPISKDQLKCMKDSMKDSINLSELPIYQFKNDFLIIENNYPKLPSKGITYCGTKMGTIEKGRFIPDHGLFHNYSSLFHNKLSFHYDQIEIQKYLIGEEIYVPDTPNGYGVILADSFPLGGFKSVNGRLKNHYPKGLRNHL